MQAVLFLLMLCCLLISSLPLYAQGREKFSAAEVKADLDYLYKTLKSSHYNLFANTPKKEFDRKYLEVKAGIKDSLNSLQVNRLFQPFVALSKMGHCVTGYPFKSYNAFLVRGGKVFPFDVRVHEGRVHITGNYSNDTTIQKGDEILAFYGVDAKKWLGKIYDYLSGENEAFKNTFIDLVGFPRLYWMVYDESKVFSLKIKRRSGEIVYVNDEGIKAADYKIILEKKPPLFNSSREFKFIGDVAYLHPGIFMNRESDEGISGKKAFDRGEFLSFIEDSFQQIKQRSSKNLIIDLRGNPGGDNSFSDAMVAYFATKPFSFCSAFYVKTSSVTKEFWRDVSDESLAELKNKILSKKDGETFANEIPKHAPRTDSLRFNGQVYVLIDRYSYSNAATTAAMIQDYRFGRLVGEQTAESPTLFAAAHEFKLPHTGIGVTYPKAFIIRPNGDKALKGVVPDLKVAEDHLTSNDEVLAYTLNYINNGKTVKAAMQNRLGR